MNGNMYQYDPAEMFKEWIQKSGKAQAEFVKNFGTMMGATGAEKFDPLKALAEISSNVTKSQAKLVQNLGSMQSNGLERLLGIGQLTASFLNWGAYKTSVGSNGRISIPEAERDALGLSEGDLVQVIILPIAKKPKNKEVKK